MVHSSGSLEDECASSLVLEHGAASWTEGIGARRRPGAQQQPPGAGARGKPKGVAHPYYVSYQQVCGGLCVGG